MKNSIRVLCLLMAVLMLLCACTKGGESVETTGGEASTQEKPPVETLVWHQGYINAEHTEELSRGDIVEGADFYSYTDVITIPKAGTAVSFTDTDSNAGENKGLAAKNVFTLSTWRQIEGEWVFDRFAPAFAGSAGNKSDIVYYVEGGVTYTYVTSHDNESIRLCYHSGQTASFTPEHVTVTIEATDKDPTVTKNQWDYFTYLRQTEAECYYPILEGVTISAIGDSYIQPSNSMKMWPDLLTDKYFSDLHNYGIGGSTVSNYVTHKNPMCDRFATSMKEKDNPGIVIVQGGRNDFSHKTPIGTVDSTDTTTFMGALNVIVAGVRAKYPDAMVVCITPWNFPDKSTHTLTHKDYVNAMMQVAEAHGVYCINASDANAMGVDMSDPYFRQRYCMDPGDVSHLNQEGMKLVMPKFEKIIAEYYADFLKKGGHVSTTQVLDVTWHMGYVGSATHSTEANRNTLVTTAGSYSYTDVFTVPKAGTTIVFKDDNTGDGGDGKFASSNAYVISSWKEVDGKWVIDLDRAVYAGTASENSDVLTFANGVATYTYTTTLDNEHLRLCYRSGQKSGFVPTHPVVTATYTAGRGTAAEKMNLLNWIEDSKKQQYYEVLEGLTINSIGDSYFAGNGMDQAFVWLNLMAKKYGQDMNNYGVNGSMVSNFTGTNNPMCLRYSQMKNNNANIILVEGGKNDYNQATPLGTVDSRDNKTYMGALNVIIDGLKTKYPDAMIVCVTPWNFTNTRNHTLVSKDYCEAMRAVAEKQGVYCLYAYDYNVSGVDMTSEVFRQANCMKPSDVSHLNETGMKLVMPRFEKVLAEFYTEFLASKKA